jgi:hypothetical protein
LCERYAQERLIESVLVSLTNSQSHDVCASRALRRRDLFVGLGAMGLGLTLGACQSTPVQAPTWADIVRRGTLMTSGQEVDRLKRIAARITPPTGSGVALQVGISPEAKPVGYAVLGNGLVISQGLMTLIENDGQLGALIAHRLTCLKPDVTLALATAMATPLNSAPKPAAYATLVFEADIAAIKALAKAGYDPRDGLVIWQRIGTLDPTDIAPLAARFERMAGTLRDMGYQV